MHHGNVRLGFECWRPHPPRQTENLLLRFFIFPSLGGVSGAALYWGPHCTLTLSLPTLTSSRALPGPFLLVPPRILLESQTAVSQAECLQGGGAGQGCGGRAGPGLAGTHGRPVPGLVAATAPGDRACWNLPCHPAPAPVCVWRPEAHYPKLPYGHPRPRARPAPRSLQTSR